MNQQPINLQYTTVKTPLPDFIYEGLRQFSRDANTYHPQPTELIEKLAKKYNLPPEMIFLTAGNDEGIQLFELTFGSNAFVFTPTYIVYSDVEIFGGKLTRIPSIKGSEFTISTDKILGASLIFLANPNNPSGITSKENVIRLVENNKNAVVVIDEAYGEFSNLSIIDEVKKYPNAAVLRSFSKSYSMAGNRIGFVVASPELIVKIKPKTQWANVSYLSVGAAITALDHEDYFINIREDINKRRDLFMDFLSKMGLTTLPSAINAVLIKFPSETEGTKFVDYLTVNNIIISHGNGNSNMGLDKSFVRIAIGTSEQMERVQEVINKF